MLLLFVFSASAGSTLKLETIPEAENENPELLENLTELYDEIQKMSQEIEVNSDHFISILNDVNSDLILINGNLNPYVGEYPFLEPVITGTTEGVKIVNSMLVFLELNPEELGGNLGNVKVTVNLLNETILKVNSDLEYTDDHIRVVNSTKEEADTY